MEPFLPKPPKPDYFDVPEPWFFRCRPDLTVELGLSDEFMRRWPKDGEMLRRLCAFSGYPEDKFAFDKFDTSNPMFYISGTRHVLLRTTLPGREDTHCLVMSSGNWSVPVEPALVTFVLERAIEFLVYEGIEPETSRYWFEGERGKNGGTIRRTTPCGVGYERGSGLCTILILGNGSEQKFLRGDSDFVVPALPDEEF
jgi:hypothetical protein